MYCVYWSETVPARHPDMIASWKEMTGEELDPSETITVPRRQVLNSDQLTIALQLCEELRRRRRNGEAISFIGMVSEDPNCVGEQGVSDKLPEGYDWKKRRI